MLNIYTLAELNWGRSALKPKTKVECWISSLLGFHAIEADTHDAFLMLDTESITFGNSACKRKENDELDVVNNYKDMPCMNKNKIMEI